MPPRLPISGFSQRFAIRTARPASQLHAHITRHYAKSASSSSSPSTDLPVSADGQGPNQGSLPTVSEEASALDKARGQPGPDLTQGTPIQEVVKRDPAAQKHLPRDMKQALEADGAAAANDGGAAAASAGAVPDGKRKFSTTALRRDLELAGHKQEDLQSLVLTAGVESTTAQETESVTLESELGQLPAMKPEDVFTRRYPAIIDQLVGLMMQHGKKGVAQKNVALILNILRTSPPPKLRADRPLLPNHPPPSWLPLNPLSYLTLAIDSLAPVIRLRAQKGAAGGGASLMIPVPLAVRQRRRTAMMWIIDAASKRRDKTFAHRVADQIVAVVEGRSALWDRRITLHKLGVASRSNVGFSRNRRKKAM